MSTRTPSRPAHDSDLCGLGDPVTGQPVCAACRAEEAARPPEPTSPWDAARATWARLRQAHGALLRGAPRDLPELRPEDLARQVALHVRPDARALLASLEALAPARTDQAVADLVADIARLLAERPEARAVLRAALGLGGGGTHA